MAQSRHLVELNGELYDATTGKIIADKTGTTSRKPHNKAHTGKVMDGVVAPTKIVITDNPAPRRAHKVGTPKDLKPAHKSAQKSKTLMRSAVKKPVHKPHHTITKPTQISPVRAGRAHSIARSRLISRFGGGQSAIQAQVVTMPVQVAPAPLPPPAQDLLQHHKPAHLAIPAAKKVDFEKAIHDATSHKQPKVKKTKLRHRAARRMKASAKITKLSTVLAAVLILGGFFFYQNLPKLSMRLAAARAGVDASLPDYQPAGFGLSNTIDYKPGEITVQYNSRSDDRSFELTQQNTEMSNEALLEEQIVASNQPYQTLENKGKIIYIYEGSNAAWINDGKLYKIQGQSALTSEQLIRMANSL